MVKAGRKSKRTAGGLLALAILGMPLLACGGEPENAGVRISEAGDPPPVSEVGSLADPEAAVGSLPPQLPRLPLFDPPAGPVGSEVTLWMDGLQRETTFYIGFGTIQEHTIVTDAETDEAGVLSTTLTIPSTARANRSHYFFVADANQLPLSVSHAYLVTDEAGFVEIRGDVAAIEGECIILIGIEDERYALEGPVPELSIGDRITVRGRVLVEGGSCEGGLNIAVEGTGNSGL